MTNLHSEPYLLISGVTVGLEQKPENCDKIIVLGDFNIHVDKESDYKAIEFINILSSMDFIQHGAGPTHNHGHTLDLVITKGLSTDILTLLVMLLYLYFLLPCCP